MIQRTDNIVDAVQNALESRGVDKAVVNNVSFHVQRAIVTLQRADLLPPRDFNFLAIDEKQEYRNAKGELVFNYIMLPKGFSKLYELYVEGYETYTYSHYINYLSTRKESKNSFSIQNINLEDFTVPVMVMAMDPFPEDNTVIRLQYHTDGTTDDLDWFGPEYWDAVIAQVEEYVGVTRKGTAEEYAHDIMSRRQNAQGRQHVNKTMQRVKPFGFGGKRC